MQNSSIRKSRLTQMTKSINLEMLVKLQKKYDSVKVLGTDNCWYELGLAQHSPSWINTNWIPLGNKENKKTYKLSGCHVLYQDERQLKTDLGDIVSSYPYLLLIKNTISDIIIKD